MRAVGNIAVIAPMQPDGWRLRAADWQAGMVFGVPVIQMDVTAGRRGVRAMVRILRKAGITAAAVRRGLQPEVLAALRDSGCTIYDGRTLLHRLYPLLLRAFCKTKGIDMQRAVFAVYADNLDMQTQQLVLDTAAQTRFLSLVTADAGAEVFATRVLEETGLALMLGDGGRRADVSLAAGGAYLPGRETVNFTDMELPGATGGVTLGLDAYPPVDLAAAEAVFLENPKLWKQYERSVKIIAFC